MRVQVCECSWVHVGVCLSVSECVGARGSHIWLGRADQGAVAGGGLRRRCQGEVGLGLG